MPIDEGDCRIVSEVFSIASERFPECTAVQLAAEAFRARHLGASISEAVTATITILFGGLSRPCP